MNTVSRSRRTCVVVGFLLLAPAAAFAQGISGTVTDDTGGVLPGVTVTAASPALIEGERIAISDSQGLSSTCGPASTRSRSRCPASARSSARGSS